MKQFTLSLGALALLGSIALTGCSEQPFGPEAMGGNVAPGASAVTPASAGPGIDPTSPTTGSRASVRLQSALVATDSAPAAGGATSFVSQPATAQRRFVTSIKGLDPKADGVGRVVVTRSGQIVLDQKIEFVGGSGEIALDTASGDRVPLLQEKDEIEVLNADGKLILFGALERI